MSGAKRAVCTLCATLALCACQPEYVYITDAEYQETIAALRDSLDTERRHHEWRARVCEATGGER